MRVAVGTLGGRTVSTLLIVFLAALWGQFFVVLAPSWSGATYYDYGWLVPPFALLFAWRRGEEIDRSRAAPRRAGWPWLGAIALGVLLVPLRVVEQVDIFWRLPLWVHALTVLGLTHVVVAQLLGGAASRAFLPATLFTLLAVPLPSGLERGLVQGLTAQVVQLASGALPLAGYPVDVAGNSLVVNGDILDVAEGCSGVRSFQSSAMAALCLGELVRLGSLRRVVLLVLGIGWAILCNAARIVVLAGIAYREGSEASQLAHDSVGFWVLIATYGGLALGAWVLVRLGRRKRTVSRMMERGDDS